MEDARPWQLRSDLIVTHVLLWVAGAGRLGEPVPGVHLYLYDRYSRLAQYHQRRGHPKRASRLFAKADKHYRRSGYTGPPPFAAAMAMPRPRPPIFTLAVARKRIGRRREPQ
jgi:hypothetical protein